VLTSDRADKIGSRHGFQSDANDSSAKLTGSWWGCYLHSGVPSVAAVYATLLQQSAQFRCRSPASSPSTLHVSWARTSPCTKIRFQETRTCTVLLPASLVRESVQFLYTSLAGHSHLLSLPSRNWAGRCGVSKTNGQALLAPYLLKTNFMKTL